MAEINTEIESSDVTREWPNYVETYMAPFSRNGSASASGL